MLKKMYFISVLLLLLLLIGGLGNVAEAAPPSECLFLSERLDKANAYSGCEDDSAKSYATEITITKQVGTLVTKAIQAIKDKKSPSGTIIEAAPEERAQPEAMSPPEAILPAEVGLPAEATPQASGCSNDLRQSEGGQFWVGDVTSSNANGEVIVFVHGINSNHRTWTGENRATQDACNNGFRVAAVNLGPFDSIWDNARLLKQDLEAITSYYGVSTVYLMAHSKGGVDAQTALIHYGASSLVKSYIAFASPFGGTDLTDFICSSYGNALQLFGFSLCTDGAWTTRPGYMSYMRAITDHALQKASVPGVLVRGTKCPAFPLSIGCILIAGDDDGVVPSWSSYASTAARPILERHDLDHVQIHQTQHYGAQIFSYLSSTDTTASSGESHLAHSNYSLRAGKLTERTVESVVVEGGLQTLTFRLLTDQPIMTVQAISPSGNIYEPPTLEPTLESTLEPVTELFIGLFLHSITVEKPEAGTWQIIASPLEENIRTGYILHIDYKDGLIVQLDTDLSTVYAPNSQLPLSVSLNQPVNNLSLKAILRQGKDNIEVSTIEGGPSMSLTLPPESRTYNLELQITGNTTEGSPFERTLITSLAAIDLSNIGDPANIR